MIDHYNAFISYKHAEEDIKVAEAVQHSLEHFHIPSKLRKKTGTKRIERIFRDKEELPITSDLSENIANALEHSDYLIVICSTNTKQSVWVPREIDYFLRNHTKKQILTVLVNGEPQDVIPDILLHEDKIITDEYGQQRTIRVALEPLSCDYRSSIKKANKNEIPRLASALIGCSYDELMNRQRQYKMKRMAIAFSIILALVLSFAGQVIYSSYKIKQNYLESLKNQSRYLSNESERFLEQEQRIKALQLALAALPENKYDKRPVTAEALRAITDATLAYKSLSGANIYATWNYTMPNPIHKYLNSPDGTYLVAIDDENFIRAWDISTHNLLFELNKSSDYIYGIEFLSDDKLILWTPEYVSLYNVIDGSIIWTYKIEDDSFRQDEIIIDSDGIIYLTSLNYFLFSLDSTNGKVLNQYKIPLSSYNKDYDSLYYSNYTLSPDKKSIAFSACSDTDEYFVGTFDLKNEKVNSFEPRKARIKNIYWIDNTHIMASYSEDDFNSNVTMDENTYLSTDHTYIQCLDKNTMSELWNYDFTSSEVNICNSFLSLPDKNSVSFCNGNMAGIFDTKTGNLLYIYNVNSPIVDMSDKDGDSWPVFITSDGGFASPYPSGGTESLTLTQLFTDNLDSAIVNNGVYVHQKNSKEIIYYSLYVYDTDWTAINEDLVISTPRESFKMEDSVLSIITDEEEKPTLTIIKPETNETTQLVLGEGTDNYAYQYRIIGTYKDKLYLSYYDYMTAKIASVDLSTMNIAEFDIYDTSNSDFSITGNTFSLTDGRIMYYIEKNDTYAVADYDIDNKTTSTYILPDDCYPGQMEPFFSKINGKIFVLGELNDCIIDVNSENAIMVEHPEEYNTTILFAPSANGKEYVISDGKLIQNVNDSGKIKWSIPCCPGNEPIGMAYYDNKKEKCKEILVAYNNGSLYRYNADNGSFKGMSDISVYANYDTFATFDFDYENNLLYIQSNLITDIIDLDSMIQTTCIEYSLGHNKPTDRFYTLSFTNSGENHIGYFKHYTLDDLIQKGKDILQGAELTDEEKSEYGIK